MIGEEGKTHKLRQKAKPWAANAKHFGEINGETNTPRTMAQHYVNVNVEVDAKENVYAWMA